MTPPNSHPSTPDCLFCLSIPTALEEEVLDTLMALPDLAPGFTVVQGHGMGAHIELASALERVQGRARRALVQIALPQSQVPRLLDQLRATLRDANLVYWVVPLLAFGRLGDTA